MGHAWWKWLTKEQVWGGRSGFCEGSISLLPGLPWCEESPPHGPATMTDWNHETKWVFPPLCCVSESSFRLHWVLAITAQPHKLSNGSTSLTLSIEWGCHPCLSKSKAAILCWITSVYFSRSQWPKNLRPGHCPPTWPHSQPWKSYPWLFPKIFLSLRNPTPAFSEQTLS